MDDFNAIRALNLQFEMQKAGSTHGTGSFFRVIFNFSARKIFPATLAGVLLFYRYLKSLKVESRQISIIIFYNIEKIVKNTQKIFTKIRTHAMLML